MFWPFTTWINCSNNLKIFEISRPSASNFKSFSRSIEHFFLTVGQNNLGNKKPFLLKLSMQYLQIRIRFVRQRSDPTLEQTNKHIVFKVRIEFQSQIRICYSPSSVGSASAAVAQATTYWLLTRLRSLGIKSRLPFKIFSTLP